MSTLQPAHRRRGRPRPRALSLTLLTGLILVSLSVSPTAGQMSCGADQQPSITCGETCVDPPSGSRITVFTILGENLDRISSISVTQGDGDLRATENITEGGIVFTVNPSGSGLATVLLVPTEASCANVSVDIFLLGTGIFFRLEEDMDMQTVQPGTILATQNACLPPSCGGDNSTSYKVTLDGRVLEKVGSENNAFSFVVRLPDTTMDYPDVELFIQTFYSLLGSGVSVTFLQSPNITSITPNTGQRGTRVVIEGERLLGFGAGTITLKEVLIGSSPATIDTAASNQTHIIAQVNSGRPNSTSITVNTTQSIASTGKSYNGPYTYSDTLWTQLEDGVITEIVPPAVQIGGMLSICGERLLGGGSNISSISIAGQNVDTFESLEPNPYSDIPTECVMATVPAVAQPENTVTGGIMIEANTGAIVESSSNATFTFAAITNVQPNEGQVGTEVTITGVELLSGYSNLEPTVYLSGVQAELISSGPNSIEVRVEEPDIVDSGDGQLSDIFNTPGDIVIVVTRDGHDFNLSLSDSWTYRVAGEIEDVRPNFGQFGTRITLTGTNLLGYGSDLREALIGNNTAMVESISSSVVVLDAPDIQFIGLVDIILESTDGAVVSLDDAFEYRERGTITRLEPASGQNGTNVTIFGTNLLGHASNISQVEFGNLEAVVDYDSISNTTIRVRVQANAVTVNTPVQVVITAVTMASVVSNGNEWTYLVPGRVVDVQPITGQFGTIVTITGTNLLGGGSTVQSILLDGVPALNVTSASSTSITVAMNDISQQIDFYRGTIHIVADTGAVVTGGVYTQRVSGEITEISPRMGREGTRVTITGNNLFGYGNRIDAVSIAGVRGNVTEMMSGSMVVVRVGAAPGGTIGRISLISNTGAVTTSVSGLVFMYTEPGTISAVTPAEGTEGSGVLIEGSSLRPPGTAVSGVTIGGSPVSRIVTESETEVAMVVGPAPEDGGDNATIVITADDGSIVRGGNFTYLELNISLTNRNQGQQGTQVPISLPNDDTFRPSLSLVVKFGGQMAVISSFSNVDRSVDVTVPRAGEVGSYTVDVTVQGTDGRVARLRDGFTYIEEGVIFSVTPDRGQRGTEIQVVGRNLLGGGSENTTARVGERGGREVTARVISSDEERVELAISENLPAGSQLPLVGDITLIANTGATIIGVGIFTLIQPGQISSVSPTRGQFGTMVTIAGTNLLQGGTREDIASITLAGREVYVILDTPSPPTDQQITVRANASSASEPGQVIITLMTGAQIITPDSITFQYPPPGVINTTTPDIGTVGTTVTISGENLLGGGQVQEISLEGTLADVEMDPSPTNSEIVVTARQPLNTSDGSGEVVIFINTGAVITGGLWQFEDLGVITDISPSVGQQGVIVTISGTSLLGSSATEFLNCSLAGVPGTVTQSLDNEARCRAGYNPAAGMTSDSNQLSGPVELITDSGPVIISDIDFSYYVAYIEEIEPENGTNGTFVTLTGRNLIGSVQSGSFDVASVTFGEIPALSTEPPEIISIDSVRVRVGHSLTPTTNNSVRLELTSGAFLELEDAWSYTEPGEITSVSPGAALPGEEVYINGTNLVPPCVSEVVVVVGRSRSYVATILNSSPNSSEVVFRPGPYQNGISATNLDNPEEDAPIQVIASNGATVYSNNVVFRYNASTARVTMVTPMAGLGGTEVTIRGTNLLSGGTTAVNITLAGRNAILVRANDTEVVVRAGDGPADGASGRVIIESDNGLLSGTGTDVWQYLPVITASDVSPQSGQDGTRVSINLRGISLTVTGVFLRNIRAEDPLPVSGTTIIVEANQSPETEQGDIRVEFSGGVELVIPDAWTYLPQTAVTTFLPDRGYFNTVVTITGTNFQAGGRAVDSVELAGLSTEIVSQTNLELRVRITENQDSSSGAIAGPVVINSVDGATYTSTGEFTYVQLRVDSVTPESGQNGTVVTIVGVGLLAGTTDRPLSVRLGGVAVQDVPSHSNTRIQLVSSSFSNATSIGDITYSVSNEGSVVIPDSWRYLQPGAVNEVTPLTGGQGSFLTIRGENMLQGGASVRVVRVADVEVLEIVVGFDDIIQVRLGRTSSLPQGTVVIVSDTSSELQSTVSFQYTETGTIGSLDPSVGQNGTNVTIRGSRFTDFGTVERVSLAGVEARVDKVNANSITVVAGRPDVLEEFSGEVVIETSSGVVIAGNQNFMYRREGLICSVDPPRGQGGTRVTIRGERLFGGGTSLESVYLAGVRADMDSGNLSDSVVMVTASQTSTAPVTGDIILIANTGATVWSIDAWSYVTPGSITNVEPQQGQFGTRMTITGIGLLSGGDRVTQITIGNVTTNEISSSTDTVVEARAGPTDMTEGFTDAISLISNYGGELPSTFTWMYLPSSVVTSVSQMSGQGNDVVIIIGSRLFGGGSTIDTVTTADVPAMRINFFNDTRVEFTVGLHPNGAAVSGDIVIESNTGARTVVEDGWSYLRACPVEQFGTFGNCMNCSQECTSCNGPTDEDCFECENFAIELDSGNNMRCVNQCPNVSTLADVCVDACESHQYSRTDTERGATFCYNCSELCDADLGCAGPSPAECGGCEIARDSDSRACVAACPLGTWLNEDRVCVPCHSQCNSSAGCFGESSAHCRQCLNFRISSRYLDDLGSAASGADGVVADFCVERCPSGFYEDEDRDCLPCHRECLDGCTGPTAFDCRECASVSRLQAGGSECVSTCNADRPSKTMYQSGNGSCMQCSSLCSVRDGCTGPTAADCIACAINDVSLPRFGGVCVLSCPNTTSSATPRPDRYYYHDLTTGNCELCDVSCEDGCSGPTAGDCTMRQDTTSRPFSAGAGTIGVTVTIIIFLAIICALLTALMVFMWLRWMRHGGYKLRGGEGGEMEMEQRYTRPPNNQGSPPAKSSRRDDTNGGPEEDYTPMSPTGSVVDTLKKRSASPQHEPVLNVSDTRASKIVDTSLMIGNEEASLYCEAGPEDPVVPERPPKPAPAQDKAAGNGRKVSTDKSRKVSTDKSAKSPSHDKTPVRVPTSTQQTKPEKKKGKKPAPLPPPDPEPEMYTEMAASVQQVYVQPGTGPEEEYSEMAPINQVTVSQDETYEDTTHLSPQKTATEKMPLIDDVYEDTDKMAENPDYVKHSVSSTAISAPSVPKQPIPKKRWSQPLPQTPLELSIQTHQPQPSAEVLYESTEPQQSPEESLYEAVPTHSRLPAAEPSPDLPPKGGKNTVQLLPRGKN